MSESSNCIFCKIVAGSIPSPRLFEDEKVIVIRDIQPHAKAHFLVLPKKHIHSLDDAFPGGSNETHASLVGHMFEIGTQVARTEGLLPNGFRSIINTGPDGGQTVFHLHLHILGGEVLRGKLV